VQWIFWVLMGSAIAAAALDLRGERKRALSISEHMAAAATAAELPHASVIVRIEEEKEGLREALESFADFDYPSYELILIAREAADLRNDVLPSLARVVLCGQQDPFQASAEAIRTGSQVVVFLSGEGRASRQSLRALVTALQGDGASQSAGYRWYVPRRPRLSSLMRSLVNALGADFVGADLIGKGETRHPWPGALALTRQALEFPKTDVPTASAPGALLAIESDVSWRTFLSQAATEWVFEPRMVALQALYCAAMAAALGAITAGGLLAEWGLVALFGLTMLKGANRATLAKAQMPDYEAWFGRHGWIYAIWQPLGAWVALYVAILALLSRRRDTMAP
jgi:hypothetical protein